MPSSVQREITPVVKVALTAVPSGTTTYSPSELRVPGAKVTLRVPVTGPYMRTLDTGTEVAPEVLTMVV